MKKNFTFLVLFNLMAAFGLFAFSDNAPNMACNSCPVPQIVSVTPLTTTCPYRFDVKFDLDQNSCTSAVSIRALATMCEGTEVLSESTAYISSGNVITIQLGSSSCDSGICSVAFTARTLCHTSGLCEGTCYSSAWSSERVITDGSQCAEGSFCIPCAEPEMHLECVGDMICLFVDGVPYSQNPNYVLNGGQPPCSPANWASEDPWCFELLCAQDTSIAYPYCELPPDCLEGRERLLDLSSDRSINVFPNPFEDLITIETNDITEITIFNSTGKEMCRRVISFNEEIETSLWAPGVYFIQSKIAGTAEQSFKKVIKN